jgi:hypothetical protein
MADASNTGTLTVHIKGFPQPIKFEDWVHDRYFSTTEMEGGDTAAAQLFVGAQGDTISGGSRALTVADTNLQRTGSTGLPAGYEMLVYSIQIGVVREWGTHGTPSQLLSDATHASRPAAVGGNGPSAAGFGGVMFDFLVKVFHQFLVNNKAQSEGPVDKYPQGGGIHLVTLQTSQEVASNGIPSPRDQTAFVLPIWLKEQIGFKAVLTLAAQLGTAAVAPFYIDWTALAGGADHLGFDVRETIEGLVKRPVT